MTKTLFILTLFFSFSTFAQEQISTDAIQRLSFSHAVYVGAELNRTSVYEQGVLRGQEGFDVRYGSRPKVKGSIVQGAFSEPFILTHPHRTEFVFVYLHGITDSAFQGKDLARTLYLAGHNVLSTRLSGHGEDTSRINTITVKDWRQDVDIAVLHAKELGNKVVLIGLSTGAALAIDKAYRNPDDIVAIYPIAPAIGINNRIVRALEKVWLLTTTAGFIEYVGDESTTQLQVRQTRFGTRSLHELYKLGQSIQAKIKKGKKLNVPGVMTSSTADTAIQAHLVPEFMKVWTGGRLQQLKDTAEAKAPLHSGLVYSPTYIAHQFYPNTDKPEVLPFAALDEANFQYDLMVDGILTSVGQ